MGCLITAILLILGYGVSWIMTCGVFYLVCLCFDLVFSWAIATGCWLVMCLLWSLFKK